VAIHKWGTMMVGQAFKAVVKSDCEVLTSWTIATV
jgi:hypothetical protein